MSDFNLIGGTPYSCERCGLPSGSPVCHECRIKSQTCSLCESAPAESKHHTIPKSRGGKDTEGLCTDCHNQIHAVLTNKEMLLEFNSIEKLKEFEQIKKWVAWRRKHPNVTVKHTMSRERKKYGKYH
jgi:5-methylcytosine-specific restriction endonuclease McrA